MSTPGLGVFRENRVRPIHRWYPFVEGYSAELVRVALKEGRSLPNTVIFDPFGGSGTTALEASLLGHSSYYAEVNPYLAWVADVKVNQARVALDHPLFEQLVELQVMLSQHAPFESNSDHALLHVDDKRQFFPSGVAKDVVGVLEWISRELHGPPAELARLACATALIPSSNMIRRTDLRRRHGGDPPPLDFKATAADRLSMLIEDVTSTGWMIGGNANQVAADIRQLTSFGQPIDVIVTSPPYLNGTNYFRNTKLELLALGFVESEQGLAPHRARAITAGINNVSARRATPSIIPQVEDVAGELDKVAYDRRIPALIRGYFSDMKDAFYKMRLQASDSAKFFLDIGDSRFAGVHIPTHDLLAGVAKDVGWLLEDVTQLRKRISYDGTDLTQVLMRFRAG
jgi:hypothetical protein